MMSLVSFSIDRSKPIDNGIRLGLSKRFFEHVAVGLHVGLVLKVRPVLVSKG